VRSNLEIFELTTGTQVALHEKTPRSITAVDQISKAAKELTVPTFLLAGRFAPMSGALPKWIGKIVDRKNQMNGSRTIPRGAVGTCARGIRLCEVLAT
jgi:hypothetical protein